MQKMIARLFQVCISWQGCSFLHPAILEQEVLQHQGTLTDPPAQFQMQALSEERTDFLPSAAHTHTASLLKLSV